MVSSNPTIYRFNIHTLQVHFNMLSSFENNYCWQAEVHI